MSILIIAAIVAGVIAAGVGVYAYNKNKKKLKPAKHLSHEHISSENNMEKYRLNWVQSTSSNANTQDVVATINGGAQTVLASGLLITTFSIEYDFEQDATIDWWVVTHNADLTQAVDSVHDIFVATNLEPLSPATGLTHEWLSHV